MFCENLGTCDSLGRCVTKTSQPKAQLPRESGRLGYRLVSLTVGKGEPLAQDLWGLAIFALRNLVERCLVKAFVLAKGTPETMSRAKFVS